MKSLVTLIVLAFGLQTFAANKNYTFSRKLTSGPRGGVTQGVPVTADLSTPLVWQRLQEEGISSYEKDRRAILALQGKFDISFEFLETILMDTPKGFDTPYFTKATEFVKVIEDKGDFISLQHIIVLYFMHNGEIQGPHVVKHWRQDWQWEASERFVYQGDKKWSMSAIKEQETQGAWTWSVYQVDDSPRYTGVGKWSHLKSASFFETNTMSRPLPRREFSVRNDYKLLMGKETLIVTKHKWYHEQKAFKHKEALKNGQFHGELLAREVGQNTYIRIKDFNWSAGEEYWQRTKTYWADVRTVWKELFNNNTSVQLNSQVRGRPLHTYHFQQAEDPKVLNMNSSERQKLIKRTIKAFFK